MNSLVIKIAFRNFIRNRKRNLNLAIILVLTTLSMITGLASFRGMQAGLSRGIIHSLSGHIQISTNKYPQNCLAIPEVKWEYELADPGKVEQIISKYKNEVSAITKRITFGGIIYQDEVYNPVKILGVDPENERNINTLLEVIYGDYFTDSGVNEIVLSKDLAEKLNVDLGDEIDILTSTPDGDLSADKFFLSAIVRVKGVDIYTGGYAMIPLKKAQELIEYQNGVNSISIRLAKDVNVDNFKIKLQKEFEQADINLRVDTYQDIGGIFNSLQKLIRYVQHLGNTVLFIVIIIGIVNSILMSVFERTREIGTVLAIGTTPSQVLSFFLMEMIILTVLSLGVGLSIGSFMVLTTAKTGISGFNPTIAMIWGGGTLYPKLLIRDIVEVFTLLLIVSIIGTLYPAFYASRKNPIDALRHV